MIIKYGSGNILDDKSSGIVIPVNTEGIAGAGLAKQWAERYKGAYKYYKLLCEEKILRVGIVLPAIEGGKWFLCFPTKDEWRYSSRIEYIRSGMISLIDLVVPTLELKSIAIPALGCGLGGLEWDEVHQVILDSLEVLSDINNITVTIYEPK